MPNNPVTLEDVKTHLRVEHAEDDGLLQIHLDAAQARFVGVGNVLGVDPDSVTEIAAPIRAAILLQVERLYDADERNAKHLDQAIGSLTKPYQVRFVG